MSDRSEGASNTPLVSLSGVSKRFGAQSLFQGLSFGIRNGERLGIIGPNGAGKSTLLRIIAALEEPDEGSVVRQRGLRISYAAQTAEFPGDKTLLEHARDTAHALSISEAEGERLARTALAEMRLDQVNLPIGMLSGGQKKRLQLALALCEAPDLLLLDEPTNHLDIESIIELEQLLRKASYSWVMVSHDRWFLENAVSRVAEINCCYNDGLLMCGGSYGDYLRRREAVVDAQEKQQESLENRVRNEQAWLRQGAKARSTKAKNRVSKAYALMESLSLLRSRQQETAVSLSFQNSQRKTKKLVEMTNVSRGFENKKIISALDLKILSGQTLGVLGRNGSGKTTFLRLLTGELKPEVGVVTHATDISISHFCQFEKEISSDTPLRYVLAEEGDSVVFRGRSVHVASWARRFQFTFEQLEQPYGALSGGEQARARIARLMLESPDLMVLDEPTNDLDIQTLELLEQSLIDFGGALVLVTHDRFMINRVCTRFVGLDGQGQALLYADYEQWEREVLNPTNPKQSVGKNQPAPAGPKTSSNRLSYIEQREYDAMEQTIQSAEAEAAELEQLLNAPEVQVDNEKLQETCARLDQAQKRVEALYKRWEELERQHRSAQ